MLNVDIKRTLPGFRLEVSFTVNHDIMAILGPSGAGKTMTLQCIAGLITPDEGRIELNGQTLYDSAQRVNLSSQRRRVGFVFQNYALFPHLTVQQNVAYGINHLPKEEADERINTLLTTMHVDSLSQRYPRQLSAGQQQRVAIARALAPDPDVLLLDEPFSALDTQLRERLEMELLAIHQDYHGSMLLVTHDLVEGYKLGTKIAVYQAGNIAQCGSREEVFASPVDRTVARLTGVRNLMDGVVSGAADGLTLVDIPAWGMTLEAVTRAELPVGSKVTVGIRPEYVQLTYRDGHNVLEVDILQAVEGIVSLNYRCRVKSDEATKHPLNATIARAEGLCLSDGDDCRIYLPPERLVVMAGE